jgi:hypothetical protein
MTSLTIYIPGNTSGGDEETTKVYYIGLRGSWSAVSYSLLFFVLELMNRLPLDLVLLYTSPRLDLRIIRWSQLRKVNRGGQGTDKVGYQLHDLCISFLHPKSPSTVDYLLYPFYTARIFISLHPPPIPLPHWTHPPLCPFTSSSS